MGSEIQRLKEIDREVRLLEAAMALLEWDQETVMPHGAVRERSEQVAALGSLIHRKITAQEVGDLTGALGGSSAADGLDPGDSALVREMAREYQQRVRLPERLVGDLARQASIAQSVWVEARKKADFALFSPHLAKTIELVKEKAECLGYEEHAYDALLDEYEPGARSSEIKPIFSALEQKLAPILARISSARQVDDAFLLEDFPIAEQEAFGREVLAAMGFDLERGRLDVSAHPFTTSIGPDDVRLTTRYKNDYFKTSIFGIIHEAGHGLYELGFGSRVRGTVLGQCASLGIHESQSRTWENLVGRSRLFWGHFYESLRNHFPRQLRGKSVDDFYRAINKVEPSTIRVEADEVTYNLHIVLRFDLEMALISGELKVDDLPDAWNGRMQELIGVRPASDADGVLQDIHWSMGSIGYFPTYALGNLYGAQFYAAMRKQVPSLDEDISRGVLSGIREWQLSNIHVHGRMFPASELCRRITGQALDPGFFIGYLENKYADIYGF